MNLVPPPDRPQWAREYSRVLYANFTPYCEDPDYPEVSDKHRLVIAGRRNNTLYFVCDFCGETFKLPRSGFYQSLLEGYRCDDSPASSKLSTSGQKSSGPVFSASVSWRPSW